MTNQETELSQYELETTSRENDIAKAEKLAELFESDNFNEVILEGYIKDEAVRLTSMLAMPDMVAQAGGRANIFEMLASISNFEAYLHTIMQRGQRSAIELEEYRELEHGSEE